MSIHDETYHALLRRILNEGDDRSDRTGTGTIGIFGTQSRYDLRQGFPLLTTKRIHTKSVVGELLWFLRGETNVRWLHERGITIWDEWADEHGNLGPVYGSAWRDFCGDSNMPENAWLTVDHRGEVAVMERGVDQIADVIESIRHDPFSRRHIVTAWNPVSVGGAALPPCHAFVQFHVIPDAHGEPDTLSCQLYQRSGDAFLGVPFNIASYALLTHILAAQVGLGVGEFVHTIGDAHIYLNHLDQVREQLARPTDRPAPEVVLDRGVRVEPSSPMSPLPDYDVSDIAFPGYDPMPAIKAPVAV